MDRGVTLNQVFTRLGLVTYQVVLMNSCAEGEILEGFVPILAIPIGHVLD